MEVEEQAIIVDSQDNVLGYKNRSSITNHDIMRVVVVWLENDNGEVLIHKRSMQKSAGPGRWENAAGGGVAKEQSYEDAAYAELAEEIGVDDVKLVYVAKNIVQTDRGRRMCAWYRGVCNRNESEFELEVDNVVKVKWINKAELLSDREKYPEKYMPSSFYWRELFR